MNTDLPAALLEYLRPSRVALAIASAEGDNHLLAVSDQFFALTGYDPDELIGRNCRLLQKTAANEAPRARLREFLGNPAQENVRTLIVNFRKEGTPFVNLLYMSRLRSIDGKPDYIFASQFDVSRSQPNLLSEYDQELGQTLRQMTPIAGDAGIVVEGTLLTIANSAATVAQAKMMLAALESEQKSA